MFDYIERSTMPIRDALHSRPPQVGRQWLCLTLNQAERIRVPLTRSSIMKKWNIVTITAIVGLAGASFGGAYAAEKLKVGFIYIGPIGDLRAGPGNLHRAISGVSA